MLVYLAVGSACLDTIPDGSSERTITFSGFPVDQRFGRYQIVVGGVFG
jgi:hypothetical protein